MIFTKRFKLNCNLLEIKGKKEVKIGNFEVV